MYLPNAWDMNNLNRERVRASEKLVKRKIELLVRDFVLAALGLYES